MPRQFSTHYTNEAALHLINIDLSSSITTLYSVIKFRQIIATPYQNPGSVVNTVMASRKNMVVLKLTAK